ncbi:hypothetical protein H920_00775 [Fukomys damarensis]|uniref:Uncharacterized protein n=1 Tax=Fukomys damarensis TaxID=885580 RepID=A0A091EQ43_FUKDA|nr:hypothetical protein H920_00775 [Fukomys damarensis]
MTLDVSWDLQGEHSLDGLSQSLLQCQVFLQEPLLLSMLSPIHKAWVWQLLGDLDPPNLVSTPLSAWEVPPAQAWLSGGSML